MQIVFLQTLFLPSRFAKDVGYAEDYKSASTSVSVNMIQRIKTIKPMSDYMLLVSFDDGKQVLYDVKEDFNLPEYSSLQSITGLFDQVQLDESRTCVFWTKNVDLPSDIIYEYGKQLS